MAEVLSCPPVPSFVDQIVPSYFILNIMVQQCNPECVFESVKENIGAIHTSEQGVANPPHATEEFFRDSCQ